CMKNRTTRMALITAMLSATTVLHCPKFTVERKAVSTMSAMSAIQIFKYVFQATTCSAIASPGFEFRVSLNHCRQNPQSTSGVPMGNEVQQRIEEDPDNIHEVPVQS